MQHIHILGIGGTFMSALAILAREAGFQVTGSDTQCYPPVSDLLAEQGIQWTEGYDDCTQALAADMVIVGNAIKRGMPVIEAVLNHRKPYTSGPQWLAEHILSRYQVIAVSGTHGKTTTTAMLTWILDQAGLEPGFLIGGVFPSFQTSARLGQGRFFVIEADEYDSAFFDKRPKFMHYRPLIAIMNNLEFDHADIYSDLAAIEQQFYYLLRCIPQQGLVLKPVADVALNRVCANQNFCQLEQLSSTTEAADWQAVLHQPDGSQFSIMYQGRLCAEVNWSLIGQFNVDNALSALSAAYHAGVPVTKAAEALSSFQPVKRRLELRGVVGDISVYDDFAHHPTAIKKTINALVQSKRHRYIRVAMECASYTMRTGVHKHLLADALQDADEVYMINPQAFELDDGLEQNKDVHIFQNVDDMVIKLAKDAQAGDAVLMMSNRGFDSAHLKLLAAIDKEM